MAVTGAGSGVGRRILQRLADPPRRVGALLAVDAARPDPAPSPPGVSWQDTELTDASLAEHLAGVDAVVHCAVDSSLDLPTARRRPLNVARADGLLRAAVRAQVARVVLVTSAEVYGAAPDNPVPLPEDAPLRAPVDDSVLGDLLQLEQLARAYGALPSGPAITVLRPAVLVGPGADTALTRYLGAPRLLVVRGGDPRWQFCHVDDLASAAEFAVLGLVEGAVAVASDGWLDQVQVQTLTGRHRLELPAGVAWTTAERLYRLGLTSPPTELAFLVHPWVVDAAKLRGVGWRPMYDNQAALRAQVALGGVDAAGAAGRGAAGAAVAVVGTAALVRAARRRRVR